MSNTEAVERRLFTVKETARIIGRSTPSVYRDIASGLLDAVYLAGSTRITAKSIDELCTGKRSTKPPGRGEKARAMLAARRDHQAAAKAAASAPAPVKRRARSLVDA